jgi:hypothetical protein
MHQPHPLHQRPLIWHSSQGKRLFYVTPSTLLSPYLTDRKLVSFSLQAFLTLCSTNTFHAIHEASEYEMTLLNQYTAIASLSPLLAHISSLDQERDVSSSAPNLRAYKTAIHHAAVSISQRPLPVNLSHPSIGTVKESRKATDAALKAEAGRLTRTRVEKYCIPTGQLLKWGYPDPNNLSLLNGGSDPTAEGTIQTCDRCRILFSVSSKDLEKRFGECRFHYGRTAPERIEGKRTWIYSCCKKERGEAGCEDGIHVFREGGDDDKLAKRVAYKKTTGVQESHADILGIDCEMLCKMIQGVRADARHYCRFFSGTGDYT